VSSNSRSLSFNPGVQANQTRSMLGADPAEAEPHVGLHSAEVAVFRGYLQGLTLRSLSDRYLVESTDADASEVVLRVWRWLAIAAGRSDNPLYSKLYSSVMRKRVALIRRHFIDSRTDVGVAAVRPSLDEFVSAEGLGGFSEAECLAYYTEKYPEPTAIAPGHSNTHRLIDRILASIPELEALVIRVPYRQDPIALWAQWDFAQRCQAEGLLTLNDLVGFCTDHGQRWYAKLGGVGPVRARAWLSLWQAHPQQLGPLSERVLQTASQWRFAKDLAIAPLTVAHAVVPMERFDPAHLSGVSGWNRGDRQLQDLAANTDFEAIQAYLAMRTTNDNTRRAYRNEIERFWLWAVVQRRKAFADLVAEDCAAYVEFLAAPEPAERWVNNKWAARDSAAWRPFRGPATKVAIAQTNIVIGGFINWLVGRGYLVRNPWTALKIARPRRASRPVALSQEDAVALREANKTANPSDLVKSRDALAAAILLETGIRKSEACSLKKGSVIMDSAGQPVMNVIGKGDKERAVPISTELLDQIIAWHDMHNLSVWEELTDEAPIIASAPKKRLDRQQSSAKPYLAVCHPNTLYQSLERHYAANGIDRPVSAVHALRHTAITELVNANPEALATVTKLAGHSDPRTTFLYSHATVRELRSATRRRQTEVRGR
jgi:site-specific recombinase XerD